MNDAKISELIEQLATEYSSWLRGVFKRYTNEYQLRWTIDDFAQELKVNLLTRLPRMKKIPNLDKPGEVKAYIRTCARNLVRDRARVLKNPKGIRYQNIVDCEFVDLSNLFDQSAITRERQIIEMEKLDSAIRSICSVVGQYSTRTQKIFEMKTFDGMTQREIAESLGQKESTIAKRWQLLAQRIESRLTQKRLADN